MLIEVVFDHNSLGDIVEMAAVLADIDDVEVNMLNAQSTTWKISRRAKKIINDYAVTKLPFVLFSKDDKEFKALYSEEQRISGERLKKEIDNETN